MPFLIVIASVWAAWFLGFVFAKNVPMLWGVVVSDNKAAELWGGAILGAGIWIASLFKRSKK